MKPSINHLNKIHIPTKIQAFLKRGMGKKLREINIDTELAKELCLLFISNFSTTYIVSQNATNEFTKEGWKYLKADILQAQVSNHYDDTYRKIIALFLTGSSKYGAVIEENKHYEIGVHSRSYRLTEQYFGKGIEIYELKHNGAIKLRRRYFDKSMENPIITNLIKLYEIMTLPTLEKIHTEARRKINSPIPKEQCTKRGKYLVYLNKRSLKKFDTEKYSVVETSINIFLHLVSNGYMIPVTSEERAGGRVIDAISLMPSWIRNLIKINGESVVECDFSCFHPNIACSLYGGESKYLTHQKVANSLNKDKSIIKIEHLSFFNKKIKDMEKSILFDYYVTAEPKMLEEILKDKKDNGHTSTTRKMFKKEVEIMTAAIQQLNIQGIYVGYIYDSLICQESHKDIVEKTMNEVAFRLGVFSSTNEEKLDDN